MNDRTIDIDDAIFRLRSLNSLVSILATATAEGIKNVELDPETLGDALYSVTHSVDTIVADLEQADANHLNIEIAPKTMKKLCNSADEELRRGKAVADLKTYASELLADAIGWKYAELFKPSEEPELSDEELDALGIPIVCIRK